MFRSVSSSISALVTVHSLALEEADGPAARNHFSYANKRSYGFRFHSVGNPCDQDFVKLIHKYSLIISILRGSSEDEIHIFADDGTAFCEPMCAESVIGESGLWICEDGHHPGHGNGGLILIRGGERNIALLQGILNKCLQCTDEERALSRWDRWELKGVFTTEHNALIDGAFPNLLFPSYGYAMPAARAWAVSFNPRVLPYAQDPHSNAVVTEHLTECLRGAMPAFRFSETCQMDKGNHSPLRGRVSRVGIALAVLPGQERFADPVADNLDTYAKIHGYALYRSEVNPVGGETLLSTLLRFAATLPPIHDQVLCITADSLVHDLQVPLPRVIGRAPLAVAVSHSGNGVDTGILCIRRDATGLELLKAAEDLSIGLDKLLAVEVERGHIQVVEPTIIASHSIFRNPCSFIVRYQGLPGNVKELVIRYDRDKIMDRLSVEVPKKRTRTDLSWLRNEILRNVVVALMGMAILVSVITQI